MPVVSRFNGVPDSSTLSRIRNLYLAHYKIKVITSHHRLIFNVLITVMELIVKCEPGSLVNLLVFLLAPHITQKVFIRQQVDKGKKKEKKR